MMRGRFTLLLSCTLLLVGCGDDGVESITAPDGAYLELAPLPDYDPDTELIKVYLDRESFEAATGPLNVATFDDLPGLGSSCGEAGALPLDNPLYEGDLVFTDPNCLRTYLCPSPLCDSTNVVLHMGAKSTIEFPPGTGGALLVVDGMGNVPITMIVVDGNRHRTGVQLFAFQGVKSYFGFTASSGIVRIKIRGTGTGGSVVLSSVAYDGSGELTDRIRRRGARLVP